MSPNLGADISRFLLKGSVIPADPFTLSLSHSSFYCPCLPYKDKIFPVFRWLILEQITCGTSSRIRCVKSIAICLSNYLWIFLDSEDISADSDWHIEGVGGICRQEEVVISTFPLFDGRLGHSQGLGMTWSLV